MMGRKVFDDRNKVYYYADGTTETREQKINKELKDEKYILGILVEREDKNERKV